MQIHQAGRSLVFYGSIIGILWMLIAFVSPLALGWRLAAAAVGALLTFFLFFFFRVPRRPLPKEAAGALFAPADGRIIDICDVHEKECLKTKALRVSIFLSIFDVHSAHMPVDAEVLYAQHHRGRFLAAFHGKSSELNEHTTVFLATPFGQRLVVRLIAGWIARRICCYVQSHQKLSAGEELGFIKFGSRVDIFLPLGTPLLVHKGQIVRAKRTQIATLA